MTMSKRRPAHSPDGTTRSPTDRDIFQDDRPEVPVKDRTPESSEAGAVD
jgi:hypothetical protein